MKDDFGISLVWERGTVREGRDVFLRGARIS